MCLSKVRPSANTHYSSTGQEVCSTCASVKDGARCRQHGTYTKTATGFVYNRKGRHPFPMHLSATANGPQPVVDDAHTAVPLPPSATPADYISPQAPPLLSLSQLTPESQLPFNTDLADMADVSSPFHPAPPHPTPEPKPSPHGPHHWVHSAVTPSVPPLLLDTTRLTAITLGKSDKFGKLASDLQMLFDTGEYAAAQDAIHVYLKALLRKWTTYVQTTVITPQFTKHRNQTGGHVGVAWFQGHLDMFWNGYMTELKSITQNAFTPNCDSKVSAKWRGPESWLLTVQQYCTVWASSTDTITVFRKTLDALFERYRKA